MNEVVFETGNPAVATVTKIDDKHGQIHMVAPGEVFISARACETDYYLPQIIFFKLTVTAADGSTGGNTNTGGNGGGSGTIGGGGTPGAGGSGVASGSGTTGDTMVRELLPQTDFIFHVGPYKVIRQVGAQDFTIAASGQVAGSTVTYESSDPAVATVDANTGTVHVVGPGTTKISATASATEIHKEMVCEYELEVQ